MRDLSHSRQDHGRESEGAVRAGGTSPAVTETRADINLRFSLTILFYCVTQDVGRSQAQDSGTLRRDLALLP